MKKKIIFLMVISIFTLFISTKNVLAEEGTFTELQQLINDNTTGIVKLEKDYINNGSESQIAITKDLTIDLNGHVINANRHGRVLYINGNINVTIIDSNKEEIHKFNISSDNLLATLDEDGTTIIKGGCITGGDSDNNGGAGIYIEGSSLIIKSGNVIGNIAANNGYGSGIKLISNSNLIIDGGKVIYNVTRSEGFGGGIDVSSGNLTLKNGTIGYNNATYCGGISLRDANSKVVMEGGEVVGNLSTHYGAGIGVSAGIVEIKDGVIKENYSHITLLGHGGGIGTDLNGTVIITGGKIINNKATRGGGIGVWRGGNIYIYGGEITGNISLKDDTPYKGYQPNKDLGSGVNGGGGVYFDSNYNASYSGTLVNLTIGKDAIIKDNYNDVTKKEDNVYISNGLKINIGTDDYAPAKMDVGITMQTYGEFTTNGTLKDAKYFSTDDEDYYIKYESNILKATKILSKPEYEVISGANQTYVINKSKEATFKINADYYLFKGKIYVDDILLESKDYTSEEGSTVIKLKKEFVDSLSIGKHTLKVSFSDSGEATTNFIIDKLKEDNPNTRDDIILYLIIGCISLISLVGCCSYIYVKSKKKKTNN